MDIRAYRQSVIQGVKFLATQQSDDGSFKPIEHGIATYHKAAYALSLMGQTDRAARLLMFVSESIVDEEGDFTGPFPRSPLQDNYYLVPNAWLVSGAQRLGRFGVSLRAIDFLGSFQHPETGGFFTAGPAASLSDEQDVLTTATCGLALLYCGRLDDAVEAGKYLRFVLDNQPASAARLFFKTRKTKQAHEVVTEFTEENASEQMITVGRTGQWYHVTSLAAGFLAILADVTGDAGILDAAQRYLLFMETCGADKYTSEKSAFLGWAAALMYAATGNQNYARIAGAVADGMVEQQLANGSWLKGSMGEDLTSDVVDATSENIICMVQIIEGLATGE